MTRTAGAARPGPASRQPRQPDRSGRPDRPVGPSDVAPPGSPPGRGAAFRTAPRAGRIAQVKPSPFVHHAPRAVDEALAVLARGRPRRQGARRRAEPASRCSRCAWPPRPPRRHQPARGAGLRDVPTTGGVRVGALARHAGLERHAGRLPPCPCCVRRCASSPIPRSATAARRSGRSPTPTRPGRCPRSSPSPAASSRRSGRTVAGRSPPPTSSRGPLRRPSPTTSSSRRCASAGSRGHAHRLRRVGAPLTATTPSPVSPSAVEVEDGLVRAARASFVSVTPVPTVLDLGPVLAGTEAAAAPFPTSSSTSCGHTSTRSPTSTPAPTTVGCSPQSSPAGRSPPPVARRGGGVSEPTAEQLIDIRIRVNGVTRAARAPARRLLSDFLRHDLRLTGTHVGCEHGVCGACTVLARRRAGAVVPHVRRDGPGPRGDDGRGPGPRPASG